MKKPASVRSPRKSRNSMPRRGQTNARPAFANDRGVYENPDFVLSRPVKAAEQIEFAVHANRVEGGQWIAEATWHSPSQHLLGDGQYPNKLSHRFASRSEAVEHALNRGLRQVRQQLGGLASTPAWSAKVESLQTWAADAVFQVREHDETLPLHGRTIIDICAGGLGGFGLGLASLGAKVQLAVEIDPKARATYERNVRPAEVHDDLCTLDGNKLSCDVLTVGLMCTAFSKAGKRKGFADSQLADVYRHTLRLLSEIDAKIIIIECARQLLTHDDGRDGATVREVLMKAGYSLKGIGATMTASGGGRARCTGAYRVSGGARGLTPREAGRMQGLPEWAAQHPVATHALRHAGNAVAVPLARELGRQLAAHLIRRT